MQKALRFIVVVGVCYGVGEESASFVGSKADSDRRSYKSCHHSGEIVPLFGIYYDIVPLAENGPQLAGNVVAETVADPRHERKDCSVTLLRQYIQLD
ncbi:hypothetical protein JN12_01781 [Geobacter argillaceus]|uniref:Uncharacterized protein n=1 Tax=Geobacter argillaceus TaxID=345631 RepID=A0A562VN91_9BACT|nr:hypothetical protein JN12_01781 [Geobacter argillaceus]